QHGGEPVAPGGSGFVGDVVLGFAEITLAFGVTNLRYAAAHFLEYRRADFAGVGTLVFPEQVLRTDPGDALEDLQHRGQHGEAGDDEDLDGATAHVCVLLDLSSNRRAPVQRVLVAEVHLQADAQGHDRAIHRALTR